MAVQWEHRLPAFSCQYITRTTIESHYYPDIKNVLVFKIFIDNKFSIWTTSEEPNAWKVFKENPLFGILGWEVEENTTSVIFLDLTISINKDLKIENGKYQKAINLYLYIPPTSSHPMSIIRGMIYCILRKYDKHNSHKKTASKRQ